MQTESQKVVLLFLFIFIVFSVLAFFLFDRKKFIAAVSNMRPFRSIHYCGLTLFGVFIGSVIFSEVLHTLINPSLFFQIIGVITSIFFAFQGAVVLNDICDVKCDKISNPNRPLVKNRLSKTLMIHLTIIYTCIALLLAISINPLTFALTFCFLTLSFIYSVPPIRLKRCFPVSSFILALAALISIFVGFSIFRHGNSLTAFPKPIIFLVMIIFTLTVNIKDIKDFNGDKKTGVKTLPVLIGNHKSRIAIGIFVLLSYILIAFFLKKPILFIPAILFGILSMVIIVKKKLSEKPIFILYFLFTLILAFSVRTNLVTMRTSQLQQVENFSQKAQSLQHESMSDLDF